jgi:hypothetical protein
MPEAEDLYRHLQTPAAVRERAGEMLAAAQRDELAHFTLNLSKLTAVSERVIAVSSAAYPDPRAIPYHGRYRHFDAGGVGRLESFEQTLSGLSEDDKLRARAELVITSVLLDAGAGPSWSYREPDGTSYDRSEGLAVASYHLFNSGALSSEARPAADAAGLSNIDAERLGRALQVRSDNPLTGVAGRAHLLTTLGRVVATSPAYFASGRLGDLALFLKLKAGDGRLAAREILAAVLGALGPIWPGRETLAGKPLGDVWRHSHFGLVPFHKLSQWLSYSLLEPLEQAGVTVTELNELTGLPEYRNGGLFLDGGVLALKDETLREREHAVSSDLVIEWRALTVALLDVLAGDVRAKLGLTSDELPLARVLQGGSWSAGRAIARELRADGGPPLRVVSDGTVF